MNRRFLRLALVVSALALGAGCAAFLCVLGVFLW